MLISIKLLLNSKTDSIKHYISWHGIEQKQSMSQIITYRIDHLHIPDLILKLYIYFKHFLQELFPFHRAKWSLFQGKSNRKDNFEYNFLKICIYLSLVINQRTISQQIKKFTNCYLIFFTEFGGKCHFRWSLHEMDICTCIKGK